MTRSLLALWMTGSVLLAGCTTTTATKDPVSSNGDSRYRVSFNLPKSQKWELVSVEQDAGGYAKSYHSLTAKGMAANQSFYINYSHHNHTPLLASMNEVESSITATECQQKQTKVIKHENRSLIFAVSANQCSNGQAMMQIFKVFNMPDGQYSIVYTANPKVVSNNTIQSMRSVVSNAHVVRM